MIYRRLKKSWQCPPYQDESFEDGEELRRDDFSYIKDLVQYEASSWARYTDKVCVHRRNADGWYPVFLADRLVGILNNPPPED